MGNGQVKFFLLFEFLFVLYKDSKKNEMVKKYFEADRMTFASKPTISLIESNSWQAMLDEVRGIYVRIIEMLDTTSFM